MRINSEKLWDYVFNLATDEKVRFKVFYDDFYTTEVLWDGENFVWDAGTFTSGAFFNPLYEFEVIEKKEITKWGKGALEEIRTKTNYKVKGLQKFIELLMKTQNEIIDIVNKMNKEDK